MLDMSNRWIRLAIFVSLLIDMLLVLAIVIFFAPVYGIVVALILVVADYVAYRILFKSGTGEGPGRSDVTSPEKLREAADLVKGAEAVNDAISEAGLPAEATVLKAWELGIDVNGKNPAVQFLLEVRPTDRPTFQASATCVVSGEAVSRFRPGSVIQVKYDPKDLTRVAIEHS